MSKELKKSLEDLKAFNKLFSAVSVIAQELEDIKKIESSAVNAESKSKKALKELSDVKDQLTAANKELLLAKEAKKELDEKVKLSLKDAEKKAADILSESELKKSAVLVEVSDLQKKADLLASGMSKELVQLKKDISDKQSELSDIVSKIELTKASLKNFIG